ncbi:MAG: hypothetical protein FJ304_22020 [Planctomycetes bacterium]|nr:hypothetical protein [Planctomycetota bacterium]
MTDDTERTDLRAHIARLTVLDRARLLEGVFADERNRWEAARRAEEETIRDLRLMNEEMFRREREARSGNQHATM